MKVNEKIGEKLVDAQDFVEENKDTVVTVAKIVGVSVGLALMLKVSNKLGIKAGYAKGFAEGIDAAKFLGEAEVGFYCPGKDMFKMVVSGACKLGKRSVDISMNAEQAAKCLNDFKTCVTAAQTGIDANLLDDLMHLPPEVLATLKNAG